MDMVVAEEAWELQVKVLQVDLAFIVVALQVVKLKVVAVAQEVLVFLHKLKQKTELEV
jgi:hypothetical protein